MKARDSREPKIPLRKSFAYVNTFLNKSEQMKEIVSIYTTIPQEEKRTYREDQATIYEGSINLLSIIDTCKDVVCCKYTEETSEIAVGFTDGIIRLFDCSNGNCTHTLIDEECRSYPGPVTAIKHRPITDSHPATEMLLASYLNGCVKCWKYKEDKCIYTIREKRQTLGLTFHPRYNKFVTFGDDSKLCMYDEGVQTQERAFQSSEVATRVDGHSSRVFACSFNPISHHEFLSGGWDNRVMCWDDRQRFATKHMLGVHMCGEGLDFNRYGKEILTCSWQKKNQIQIWDYSTCKVIKRIEPDQYMCKLYCGRYVPHTCLMVCGGSDDNILRVVDTTTKKAECWIRNNPGPVVSFDFGHVRRKVKKEQKTYKISELHMVPRVAFVSGKRLQIVDFS